ncbi:DUF262 domain-containing protein [Glaesserella sp.]|uniref:DUF262 domain-containing protein n=1 Tax=Glaesserella sp. TaxID=2094731 RepID=UPI0035A019BE
MQLSEMHFDASHKTFSSILEANNKYIIPRYQREYSWDSEIHVKDFWEDLLEQIDFSDKTEFRINDYFIGSVVLVGYENKSTEFLVIDGQQRITTLTILLSVLTHIGKSLFAETSIDDFNDFSDVCYRYIEGRDRFNKPFFKLVNETPKPFFQNCIQYENNKIEKATTEEEKKLKEAYDFFYKKIKNSLDNEYVDSRLNFLIAIREQALKFSVINITVNNEVYAQKIFETLNTKGKELETIDLIKNKLFGVLNDEHPDDNAKTKWKNLKNILASRDDDVPLSKFFYQYWVSKYKSVAENKIYSSFLKTIPEEKEKYNEFLDDIILFSKSYIKVSSPLDEDWKELSKKDIYKSLKSLRAFKSISHRTLVTTLLRYYDDRLIKLKTLKRLLLKMSLFHFVFIIVQFRTRIEITYAKYSRMLNAENKSPNIKDVIKRFEDELDEKVRSISLNEFESKFLELKYSDSFTNHKEIIKFIFDIIENKIESKTKELKFDIVTLEHIRSQKIDTNWSHKIGNLLPLSEKLNADCANKEFKDKLKYYKNSDLKQVKKFCDVYGKSIWNEELSQKRAQELAKQVYDYISHNF